MFDPNQFDKTTFTNTPFIKKNPKPWGYELIFTPPNLPYTGKIIHINAGKRLSLQTHDKKQESWLILKGRAKQKWRENAQEK
jgi:mannose-6-phosphate isomerase-like protein (cupin superfamily)